MDLAFLIGYVALIALAYSRARSTAWQVISTGGVAALFGAALTFAMGLGYDANRLTLQWSLLAIFAVVVALAWIPTLGFAVKSRGTDLGRRDDLGWARQALVLWLPIAAIVVGFIVMSTWWTAEPAFLKPVSFLIGHGDAEDNAKWLDFTSQFAAGGTIDQWIPMGAPLQFLMTFVGTLMGVISTVTLGGYNEVAVAANTVVYGQFLMVGLVLLALAPLVESRFRGGRVPAPLIWISMVLLSAVALVLVGFGHLTLQFTILVTVLWSVTFLSGVRMNRARLLTSLLVATSMTVWLPLNVVAAMVLFGWLVVLIWRALLKGWRSADLVGLGLTVLIVIAMWEPIRTSALYAIAVDTSANGSIGGAVRGISAAVRAAIEDSPVFGAQGGTEQAGPILGLLALTSVVAAAVYFRPIAGPLQTSLLRRFLPLGLLAVSALGIYLLDFWVTGEGPHYGSLKFTFMLIVVALVSTMPLALMLLSDAIPGRMAQAQWIAVAGILILLTVDSLLPRAVALLRPDQWSPPIPFNNTSGSYWYPAEVNGTAIQPVAKNPVACVYLPEGSAYPTALVPSGLSDAQRVYSCSRQLAGLAGLDFESRAIVDWLRREWFTNTPAWTDVYDILTRMDPRVLNKPVILLDDGSNVIGTESVASLLQRFPKPVE